MAPEINRRRFFPPLSLILFGTVVVLGLVPILTLQTYVYSRARRNVEEEVVTLTRAVLESTRDYIRSRQEILGHTLEHIRDHPEESLSPILAADVTPDREHLFNLLDHDEILLISNIEGTPEAWMFRPNDDPESLGIRPDRGRDTLSLITDSPGRTIWLGALPFLEEAAEGQLWALTSFVHQDVTRIAGVALNAQTLESDLAYLSRLIGSPVVLIAPDNTVINDTEPSFFDSPWAPRALTRTDRDRLIEFLFTPPASPDRETLIQVYADSVTRINLVVAVPRQELTRSLDETIVRTSRVYYALGFGILLFIMIVVYAISRRIRRLKGNLERISRGDYPEETRPPRMGVRELESIDNSIHQTARLLAERDTVLKKYREDLERQVRERTADLERTIRERERAYENLLQSEKMAALGRTVAAFTHEVNNPLAWRSPPAV